jgi:hypothetical protein
MNRRRFAIHSGQAGAALLLSPDATAGDEGEDKRKRPSPRVELLLFSPPLTKT